MVSVMVACNVKREERERPVTLGRELGTSASGISGGGRARRARLGRIAILRVAATCVEP